MVTALTMARLPLSAERAHELGFVNELADKGSLEATVARLMSVADLELKANFGGRPPQNYADAIAAISAKLYPQ